MAGGNKERREGTRVSRGERRDEGCGKGRRRGTVKGVDRETSKPREEHKRTVIKYSS